MANLSVNINKIATLRNSRGGSEPSVVKTILNKVSLLLSSLFIFQSCLLPEGVTVGPITHEGKQYVTLSLSRVALSFDLGNYDVLAVDYDYGELKSNHNVVSTGQVSGVIDNLSMILWNEDNFDDDHKPSIIIKLEDNFNITTHRCMKEDISWNTVFGIPVVDYLYKATVEIRSIKTSLHGVQVTWKKTAVEDAWPINEFIEDGSIICDLQPLVKGGTNNDSGNIAVRDNFIISNTIKKRVELYTIEEDPYISPDLQKPILIGGDIIDDVKWDKPLIYKPL